MNSTQIIQLSHINWRVPNVIHAVQNDTSRQLKMILADGDIASGSTAELSIARPDGSHYSISCTLNVSENSFTCNITQALTQVGSVKCQLKISGIVSTYMFIIEVQESTDGTPTEQEGWTIKDAVDKANEAYEAATDALEAAQDAITELSQIYAGVVVDITADGTIEIGEIEEES